jgi:hypothetical protein
MTHHMHHDAVLQYVPNSSQSSLIVAVRVRPLLKSENAKAGRRDIMRVIDGRIVVVLDPDESKVCHRGRGRRGCGGGGGDVGEEERMLGLGRGSKI